MSGAGAPAPATYPVTFTESGLPSGSAWGVTINGTLYFAPTGSTVGTDLPDGPFTYAISDVPGWHQTTLPYSGSGAVNGGPVNEPTLQFVKVNFPVSFNETGLPGVLSWSVTINGTLYTAPAGTPIATALPNGTFTYEITDVPGWHQATLPYSGSGSVRGSPVNEPVLSFTEIVYSVAFRESGMPTAAGGGVDFAEGGTVPFGSGGVLAFTNLANGSYSYAITAGPGYVLESPTSPGTVAVIGFNVTVVVTFAIPHTVTFVETGMPASAGGGVRLNGAGNTPFGAGGVVSFTEPNGSYPFTITAGAGYQFVSSDPNSSVDVAGANVTVTATFEAVYAVTFAETGMPTAAGGGVSFNGGPPGSFGIGGILTVLQPNGSHPFSITAGAGYQLVSSEPGSPADVAGANVTVTVAFEAVYAVTFTETGMPVAAGGSVSFNGNLPVPFGTGGTLTYTGLVNGSYSFAITAGSGYRIVSSGPASPAIVDGSGVTVTTVFEAVYTVTFTESGMPVVAGGGLSFNGGPVIPFDHGGMLSFTEANGSYTYTITAGAGYALVSSTPTSPVVVSGSDVSVVTVLEEVYPVTFTQTGLTNGTRWMVQVTLEVSGGEGPSWFENSTTSTAVFEFGNGTYGYVVTASGYQTVTGGTTVSGQATGAQVALQPTPAPGTTWWVWVAVGVVIVAVAVGGVFGLRRWRGRGQ